jgi:hypothetical protein
MFAKALAIGIAVLFTASWAGAVVVDGVNDFPAYALIDADGGDTEFAPLDLGDIYVTYDSYGLYVGYAHDQDGWTGVQIGMAFVTSHSGGSTDPWSHQIAFAGVCLPEYVAYVNIDSNWNEWCVWDSGTSSWVRTANVLNWVVSTGFDEFFIPWSELGIDCRILTSMGLEIWVTQDGSTKGPLDLGFNDAQQLSKPSGTTWDITSPVVISCYYCIVLDAPSGTEPTTWGNIKALYK